MARTEITVNDVDRDGIEEVAGLSSDFTNGMFFTGNDGNVELQIENTDSVSRWVDIVASPTYTADGLTVVNLRHTIPAGEIWRFGPYKVATFRQNPDNDVYINPEVNTMLKLAAYRRLPA